MAKRTRVTDEERARIIAASESGKSCNQLAKEFKRATTTISNIAKSVGHEFGQTKTKKAREVLAGQRKYDREGRLAAAELAMQHQMDLLEAADTPHKKQAWWIGFGIGNDKIRENEVSHTEGVDAIRELVDKLGDARTNEENGTIEE